ncbi:hypothetical protein [Quadrisphaera sp. DSM 44207]|uniref:hypothetical protein n=1 Tax=Quadrisphaera sp. DSM 44207 TaxID=1881057 RepID=UPI0008848F3E|nr:hypothetical protein [Quadrisphaera sp. DSM 44207]SDQ72204.1 SipW-cognate class signal peptide [Quadrisphaera sp. DSM 44207]
MARPTARPARSPGTPAKLALTAAVLLGASSAIGGGTHAALSSTTANPGNAFTAGTVRISDNDVDGAMLTLSNARPGVPDTGCIRVTYTGSIPAPVRLHGAATGALAPYLKVTVVRGTDATPSFDSCAGFTADTTDHRGLGPGVLYSGTLAAYPTSFDTGVADPLATWPTGRSTSYRISVEVLPDNAAQGLSAGAAFRWEARA